MASSKDLKPLERLYGKRLVSVLPAGQPPWYRTPHLLKLNGLLFLLILSATGMGFDGSMMNGLQSLSTWADYFDNPSSYRLGIVNAVLNVGPIIFGGITATIADRWGRRRTAQLGCLTIILSSVLQAASQNLATFAASRFLIGVGIVFCMVPSPVLVTELAYPTHRSKLTSLYFTFYFFGAIMSSWITFGTYRMSKSTWTWRIPSLLQAIIPSIQFLGIFWVPESPRWLISKGRREEAQAILVKYHAGGDSNSPLVDFEMEDIQRHLLQEADHASTSWTKILSGPGDKKRLAIVLYISICSQLCGNGIISYYLPLILDTVGIEDSDRQTLINGILQIYNWFVAIGGSLLVDRVGRRRLWLFAVGGMLMSFIIWTTCSALYAERGSNNEGLAIGVLVLIFVFQFHYSVGVTPLCLSYPVEILPFHSRQKVMGLNYIGNSLGNLFNSLVSPIALDNIGWRYYLVYVVILLQFFVVVYLFFPETKGYTLEQVSDLFESGKFFTGHIRLERSDGDTEDDKDKHQGLQVAEAVKSDEKIGNAKDIPEAEMIEYVR
ncbi:general substrate transporter [Aspergillus germanicus]